MFLFSMLTRAPSAAVFGGTAASLLVYFTDWRVIADYIPFYNGKFPKEEEAK